MKFWHYWQTLHQMAWPWLSFYTNINMVFFSKIMKQTNFINQGTIVYESIIVNIHFMAFKC